MFVGPCKSFSNKSQSNCNFSNSLFNFNWNLLYELPPVFLRFKSQVQVSYSKQQWIIEQYTYISLLFNELYFVISLRCSTSTKQSKPLWPFLITTLAATMFLQVYYYHTSKLSTSLDLARSAGYIKSFPILLNIFFNLVPFCSPNEQNIYVLCFNDPLHFSWEWFSSSCPSTIPSQYYRFQLIKKDCCKEKNLSVASASCNKHTWCQIMLTSLTRLEGGG